MSEPEAEPEPYLILHKVRGKAAFDIAHRLQIGNEEGWIVSTSGHRAYPYHYTAIKDINWRNKTVWSTDEENALPLPCPPGLPDHFTTSRPRTTSLASEASDLLSSLGLHAKRILRRI